jgi:5-methylcytosine-specific restriction endonuclease McrA
MDGRLFPIEEYPEVPIVRPPARRRSEGDARFRGEYPPEWHECPDCAGNGFLLAEAEGRLARGAACERCLGMGSLKARVRREAGHRCLRCLHPYVPKGDAAMLGVEPSWREGGWSPCDEGCDHRGPLRFRGDDGEWVEVPHPVSVAGEFVREGGETQAAWRILTVHHLDGDKGNVRWWNLVALCQVCHLSVQSRVVMQRVYPHPHTDWFRPFVAGYYAFVYLGEDLPRPEVEERMDELLALELAAS